MADLQAVVFDFDGLVIDTEWCEYVTAAEQFRAHGTELNLELWKTFIGSLEHPHWTDILEEQLGRPVDRDVIVPARRRAHAECTAGLEPLPGVVTLRDAVVAAGLPVAIASSSPDDWVTGHLAEQGLLDRFPVRATGDEVHRTKPDPAVYLLACERLGVDPSATVAIEDSVNGVAAAKAAGMAAVAVPGSLTRGMDFSHADLEVGSCLELSPDVLRGLVE
ncbi:HAD family hydrolase [Dermatobacter hominis]|uniref:HAD family hydrolase n=1 Tax=Dermatobacter hominis TaxID=2884263 RepID=UPI001D10A457|nr:HAD family phosphatase [Dermatobacter hominis]UDY33995.1 HAD family phosphatase [Dermatobacter hominis]